MNETTSNSDLAALEIRLRRDRALGDLALHYVHRAKREDAMGFLIGREALLADWVTQSRGEVTIKADFGDMIAFDVAEGTKTQTVHKWVVREGGKIISETLIENRLTGKAAPDIHPPLGELRAGRGQYDAGETPILPADFPSAAVALAAMLHRAWNGRSFDLYETYWLTKITTLLPDATFYFERALTNENQIAVLWRVHGHAANGQRVRLIGSSVMEFEADEIRSDDTVIDFAALDAQLSRSLIDYS